MRVGIRTRASTTALASAPFGSVPLQRRPLKGRVLLLAVAPAVIPVAACFEVVAVEMTLLGLDLPHADTTALRFPDRTLTYGALLSHALRVARDIDRADLVAVWAEPTIETAVAIVGALLAGVPAIPVNPRSGERELTHILADGSPDLMLTAAGSHLPSGAPPRVEVDLAADRGPVSPWEEADESAAALVVYTSGTTGAPKGVVLSRGAIAANLDALAKAWEWSRRDVVGHALPLFHVHGLVLGILGPLRRGGTARHFGRFTTEGVTAALCEDVTMLFGVPTMYRRLAEAAERDPAVGVALGRPRLLVSGSAALPAAEHARLEQVSRQRVVERYGMTETLMITAVRADGDRRPGYVGTPLEGVELRLVDDDGIPIAVCDDATIGEVEVRGPSLFTTYLNRPDATADAIHDRWFRTGDLATRADDGYVRIVGRRATDLIKSGGYKIGAGEIEAALREHPGVVDAAVTGEPDPDLGERVVAWVVAAPTLAPDPQVLADHVAALLAPHKRPRVVHFVEELPRNELGKVQKQRLVVP